MKRILATLLACLAAAVLAHVAWFEFRKPPGLDSLKGDLAWMRVELGLDEQQYARIVALHEKSSSRLIALASQVARMRREFESFERVRRTESQVDFIEFARFVEASRAVDRECLDSTHRLVQATADLMGPGQRERYMKLVQPAAKGRVPTASAN
jgi:hypothetical protein